MIMRRSRYYAATIAATAAAAKIRRNAGRR